jgi:hypothetical protein
MVTEVHHWLAYASAVPVLLAGIEGATRAWRRTPPGALASGLGTLVQLLLGVTIAGGLGLLVGGARPHELLHFVYAVLVFGALPVANSLSGRLGTRGRGAATFLGAAVALCVIARLIATG